PDAPSSTPIHPPLRIGVLAPEFPPMVGGMAELARGLAQSLAGSGDEIILYTRPTHGLDDAPFEERRVLSPLPGDSLPELAADEPRVDLWLAMNAGLTPLAKGLHRPFFVYFHGNDFVNPFLACGPAWLERLRRPYAATVRHALRRRAIAAALPRVRGLFTNSHQTAALITDRFGVGRGRIQVAYPGVADVFFQPPGTERDDDGPLRLLTVSRLSRHSRRKNVDGVLEAVAQLMPRVPIRYTIVGDGDDRERLEALARQLGIDDAVTFTGAVEVDELLAAYRRADLFVMASKASDKDVEGFGIVYTEAASGGVPSICSREGGATDAVVDGRNGILIPDSSPPSIAAGIERFLAERDRFTAESARDFAEAFRWPAIAAGLRRGLVEALAD
ncbi:MAG: glycosyltransferase family 4 protein, partial [Acidobacteriota bacterium]